MLPADTISQPSVDNKQLLCHQKVGVNTAWRQLHLLLVTTRSLELLPCCMLLWSKQPIVVAMALWT